jgi:DNA-directed RNA polymerase specialized sigma24 family protein
MDDAGDTRVVRGIDPDQALRKLGALRDADGNAWLEPGEMRAAARLRHDWLLGQIGLMRGSDWQAPPRTGGARGPGNGVEQLAGARYDARRRVEIALDALASPLRRTVEAVCLHEQGIEALEREQGWPARSGKIALKLGLAQLASQMR